ncbi:NAD(P)/FAD-dependent oxidoreductase [Xanthovirga aplysinae]|uniref:NAD(P)/FAD-dependent oxidoreductase n=1 Tax=Xanthovirga aplysinae TaxID=2529853 RepID=UPI0012BCC58A|nr:FAD-dependent oxidoreductase [Xanthovirga aplysinae]MTI31752.1 FAD-binding oxidoreductase [Xanthovirga aplysinae]
MEVDYLIIGQGIAGTCMSYQLMRRGKKVMVIDQIEQKSSSEVAAGLFNPITGRKMKKSWKADTLFPNMISFYRELEEVTKSSFLHEVPIYRPFFSIEEQNEWMAKSADLDYQQFIHKVWNKSLGNGLVKDPFGGLELKMSGYLDIPSLLEAYREYLRALGAFRDEQFMENELKLENGKVKYKNLEAHKVVFCNGPSARFSKYFSWLPFRPVKGELLHIETDALLDKIYNRGVFVVPTKTGICKVGATYNWKELNHVATSNARTELEEKLNNLVIFSYEVIDQKVGVRPATKDRKPFLGSHPNFSELAVFNGLGTKGVSLSPYFSEQLADFFVMNKELDMEVNINRYISLYSP